MGEVKIIKAIDGAINRRQGIGSGLKIERKRVAAYVRVSTDDEEQLQSFQSQKKYYEDKISKNKEWAMVGIYADEGITGTKIAKRDGFLRMIDDCMNGLTDVILTKSISRFSRNLVDTLQYVRMLKEKNIAIIFEKENINTLSMESEMALALLSTLAQNEVESLSANVKMGIKMKMKRGELMGFNGCLGYDYHPEDKTITLNNEEAKIVRFIYDMYLQGYGTNMIKNELIRLKKKNNVVVEGTRVKLVSKYAFSSMCECAFCGKKFTRRAHNQDRSSTKLVWKCSTSTKKGIAYCPHSKAIDESVLESAFLEMFDLLAVNYEDILEEVLGSIEECLSSNESSYMINRINKQISNLENRRRKLTDMLLDDKISKEAYDDKYDDLTIKIEKAKEERNIFLLNIDSKKDVNMRMKNIRNVLAQTKTLEKFDRVVFESIVDKIIIGDIDGVGNVDPYKLTFVLKGVESRVIENAKVRYKNGKEKI